MELTLEYQALRQISVICDGHLSHPFDLSPLQLPAKREHELLVNDPVGYGRMLYAALFPAGSLAQQILETKPERIVLIAEAEDVDAIPWEYIYGPDGFLVLEYPFVRSLAAPQQQQPPELVTGLHIVAVPSNPLNEQLAPLNIDAEWLNLRECVTSQSFAVTLERTRPPTITQLRNLVAGQRQRVVHFIGHGGQNEEGAILCFEREDGGRDIVSAKEVAKRLRGTTFLVTLNACVSARPGPTQFSNFAATLVRQRIPYALGMRLSIYDDDARVFSRAFYDDLAHGTSVEVALWQARMKLARESQRPWVVGVPVLYTSLVKPAGFLHQEGTSIVREYQPPIEVMALPRAEEAFQGRRKDLHQLGSLLTGDGRPRIVTIHGGGGQGKTALAREAAERFAWAWPNGVWSISLENLPDRALFAADLARFLGINPQEIVNPDEMERLVLTLLSTKRLLIVLDNAETLVDSVEANDERAQQLAQLLQQLSSPSVSLLVTSRTLLGWPGEVAHELDGLTPEEGAQMFRQSSSRRHTEIEPALACELSRKVEGHPLSLRLLGGAFNFTPSAISLATFVQQFQEQLAQAENKYLGQDHRQRTLYACIDISVRSLSSDLRNLLSELWIFHAPFLPESTVAIFDPGAEDTEDKPSLIHAYLHQLWLRGLLTIRRVTTSGGTWSFFYVLPTTRPYLEQYLSSISRHQEVVQRFGATYARLIEWIYAQLDRTALAAALVQQIEVDLEHAMASLVGIEQARYKIRWAWILHRLGGTPQRSLDLLEEALDEVQGHEQDWTLIALNNMAGVYGDIGQPSQALALYEQALPITHEVGDRAGEATTLNNMALVYGDIGQPSQALALYEQALPITREVGDRAGAATTLSNMAVFLYTGSKRKEDAILSMEQAIQVLQQTGLTHDAAGGTLEHYETLLQMMQRGLPLATQTESVVTLPEETLQKIIATTVATMTQHPEFQQEWRGVLEQELQKVQQQGDNWQIEVAFFTALLVLIDGQTPFLPADHPYASVLAEIQAGITSGGVLNEEIEEEGTEAQNVFDIWITNTLAVLGPRQEQRSEWRDTLVHIRSQTTGQDALDLVALLDAIIGLLDANGNPIGLGEQITETYARVWQAIVSGLHTS